MNAPIGVARTIVCDVGNHTLHIDGTVIVVDTGREGDGLME